MQILLTNNTLAARAGSELYVRDVALGLLARGHSPVCFSTILGEVADELRRATVPVIDNLDQLGDTPDVIHGQHHIETAMAALRFPSVPVLSFCHGWLPWEEAPTKLPNVQRYVAVDLTCRDRLRAEHGIPTTSIDVLLNFVDLRRFPRGNAIAVKPKRALVFGNAANTATLEAVREACRRHGISVDCVGASFGAPSRAPESILAGYDIVFAKARAALEAMATGRAVVLFDAVGSGPLVQSGNFDTLRGWNFGIRSLAEPATVEHFERQIAAYDHEDSGHICERVRAEADLELTLDTLERIYNELVSAPRPKVETAELARLASEYIGTIAARAKRSEAAEKLAEAARLTSEGARDRHAELAQELVTARAERDAANARVVELNLTLETARDAQDTAEARLRELEAALHEVNHSPVMRLRQRVIDLPLAGPATRRLGKFLLDH